MLEVDDLHAYYGKSHILQGVSFTVGDGEIVSLLGRNGAGRSTTVKTIMGTVPPVGSIRFNGDRIDGLRPHEIARKGLGYVPEDRAIFPTLTVREEARTSSLGKNVGFRRSFKGVMQSEVTDNHRMTFRQLRDKIRDERAQGNVNTQGDEVDLWEKVSLPLASLIFGLVGAPLGVRPQRGSKAMGFGIAILIIEQKLTIALAICHRLYVMGHGRIVFEGNALELRADDSIRREWLEV